MHISHGSEDRNLESLLKSSLAAIKAKCGEFSIDENDRAKELVFERARYAYNDALEYFDTNFLHEITSLGLDIEFAKEGDTDAGV
ncbi:hypothetical protein [Halobacillus sp. BBL2006]|uniref:hypothetical protein n=1 Tax=Halobacillus sp. BBL2006 TaxID=1543706 RepID=UPI00068949C0|nr:hypothetical protein [Halobacillus sp. BBL2006]